MYFLFIKVIEQKYKNDIFLALESVDINKASYFDAYNLDISLTDQIPILKGLFLPEEEKYEKQIIITAMVKEIKQVEEFVKILEESGMEIRNQEIIRLMTMPINYYFESGMK